jgi:hypothetical protein
VIEIIDGLIHNSSFSLKSNTINLKIISPIKGSNPIWSNFDKPQENPDENGNQIFIQIQSSKTIPLFSLDISVLPIQVIIPENLELNHDWLEQRSGISYPPHFSKCSHSIATTALTYAFPPNRSTEKELSSSSGELWIDGLRRFIASGYTYQNIFLKKSRRNQKAYSITIVIDSVQRLFTPFNVHHTISTIVSLIGAFPLIPESDDIILEVIAVSCGKSLLLVHNFSVL